LATLAGLLGIDAAADGQLLVFHTLRQSHRLALTWDMLLDPVTGCFLAGSLAMLAVLACSRAARGRRWRAWLGAAWRLAIIVLAWLPLRTLLLLALYVDRVGRADESFPLYVMNQFFSPLVHLGLIIPVVLAAWRWVRLPPVETADTDEPADARKLVPSPVGREARDEGVGTTHKQGEGILDQAALTLALSRRERGPGISRLSPARPLPCSPAHFRLSPARFLPSPARLLAWSPALVCLLGAALLALGIHWQPAGPRKEGRVMWVERHSTWSPTTTPYDTATFGGDERDSSSYTYRLVYEHLGQFYQMSRLTERERIDDATLARCDVLVVKIPGTRYAQDEVDAVVRFVRSGGGILLIGDHTNLEKSSSYMNDITRHFGFTFRDDVLWGSGPAPDEYAYLAPRLPHPALAHVPKFDFAVSCSIEPGFGSGGAVVRGTGLWSDPAQYHSSNFMGLAQHVPQMRGGAFVQAWATPYGRGRAAAWADSTIFSTFCLYQPGKVDVMMGLVEWLNHQEPALPLAWLPLALGAFSLAGGLTLAVRRGGPWLVLLAAAACGWTIGSEAVAAIHRHSMPLPQAVKAKTRVVIDRSASQVPLADGAYPENKQGQGYALLEQWIPRLGYATARAAGDDEFSGEALVVIAPSRPVDAEFRRRLVRYVAEGGRLLVIEPGGPAGPSTANLLLRPFGLAFQYQRVWGGWVVMAGRWPWLPVEHAWEVVGGQRVASLGGERTVCATARYGQGLAMAVGFGSVFNDAGMGGQWWHHPDAAERLRYDTLFALLRLLVEDK
jgi:hypothetical protein